MILIGMSLYGTPFDAPVPTSADQT